MISDLCLLGEAVGIAAWVVEYDSMYAVCMLYGVKKDVVDSVAVTERRTMAKPGTDVITSIFTTAELKVGSHIPYIS